MIALHSLSGPQARYFEGWNVLRLTTISRYLPIFLLFLSVTHATGQDSKPTYFKLGDTLPPLTISRAFNGFPNPTLEWSTLRGKVVVLEFWATWCVPCVEAIPHLNKLADETASEDVVLISVAVDDPSKVLAFLEKTRIKGWVASATYETQDEFAIYSYPQTYILGPDGKIAAITLPESVSKEAIRRVRVGKPADVSEKDISSPNLNWDIDSTQRPEIVFPKYEVIVKETSRQNCGFSLPANGGNFIADGCTPDVLLQTAFQVDSLRSVFHGSLSHAHFRVAVRILGASPTQVYTVAQESLSQAFDVKTQWEVRERDVLVLRRSAKLTDALKQSSSPRYSGLLATDTGLRATGDDGLRGLIDDFLEPKTRSIVINETNLDGSYDWSIQRNADEFTILERDLGLRLIRATRPVKTLVVDVVPKTMRR
jgi:uncharacterized protein (TIGR03435 family)